MSQKILFLGFLLAAQPLFALNSRSAVSVSGIDTNPCTIALPCRSFSVAVPKTLDGGDIVALDTAGYGSFTIDRSLGVGGAAGVHAAITTATDGITVNTPGAVTIHNLDIISTRAGFATGVNATSTATLRVIDCLIEGFQTSGVRIADGDLDVARTTVLDCSEGVALLNSGPAATQGTIEDSLLAGDTTGVSVFQNVNLAIHGTTITRGNTGIFLVLLLEGSHNSVVAVERSIISYQGVAADLAASGTNTAELWLSDTLIAANNTPFISDGTLGGGLRLFHSFRNNEFAANKNPPLAMVREVSN